MRRNTKAQFTTPNTGQSNTTHVNPVTGRADDIHSEPLTPGMLTSAGNAAIIVPARKQSPWRNVIAALTANRRMLIGLCMVGFFVLFGLIGPLLAQQSPTFLSNDLFKPPYAAHWLGTTQRGEDIFAQLAYGTRTSLLISFTAAIGSTFISMLIGLSAGYFGGWTDDVLSFFTNIFLVLPGMPLAIVIASFAVKGTWTIILVLLLTSWPWGARVLRAQTLSMRQREFVTAARTVGESSWRIIFSEILPNEIAIVASSLLEPSSMPRSQKLRLNFWGWAILRSLPGAIFCSGHSQMVQL